jgi:hypothetical protein
MLQAIAAPPDSVAEWWRRIRSDSADAGAWLALGRAYVGRATGYHDDHATAGERGARAALDTAAAAFRAAAERSVGGARDSALAFGAYTWGETRLLAWELLGIESLAGADDPADDPPRLPAVLAELGENLLRACPAEGVLLTAEDADTYSAWLLWLARRLRPDLSVVPLAIWRADPVFRARLAADLLLPRGAAHDAATLWRTLVARRPVCASMAFAEPPLEEVRLGWRVAPLVWVAGPDAGGVAPPGDFVFEAARVARNQRDPWLEPALRVYRRAAGALPALCPAFIAFHLGTDTGCVRTE